ncbi:MAG TPA: hypothetical protein VGB50_02880 [Flavobacterium sp.]|jgi:hypothetical protein
MKAAEILLKYMDRLRDFFEILDSYINMGIQYLGEGKKWLEKILDYIDQAITSLVEATGGRKPDARHPEEHMFV